MWVRNPSASPILFPDVVIDVIPEVFPNVLIEARASVGWNPRGMF